MTRQLRLNMQYDNDSNLKILFMNGKPKKDWVLVQQRLTVPVFLGHYKCHLNEIANTRTENTLLKMENVPVESRDLLLPPLEELVQGTMCSFCIFPLDQIRYDRL